MALGLGQLKPDTTGSNQMADQPLTFQLFPLVMSFTFLSFKALKAQSDAHYSSKKIISL